MFTSQNKPPPSDLLGANKIVRRNNELLGKNSDLKTS